MEAIISNGMSGATAEIRLLLWVQLRSLVNGLVIGEPSARLKNAAGLLVRLVAFVVVYAVMRYGLFGLGSIPGSPSGMVDIFFSSLIHALGAILLLGAIKYAYQVFYLSDDLEWLLASPIPTSRIFAAKFTENLLFSGQIVFSMGWPLCIAYGAFTGAPVLYYPIAIVTTAVLAVYTGSIGILICLPLMRYVTAKRLRELLLMLSMGLSIGLYFIFRQMGIATVGASAGYNPAWLPTTYLGDLLKGMTTGEWHTTSLAASVFIPPAFILAWMAYRVSQKLYLQGLQRKGEEEERIRAARGESLLYRLSLILPADIRAVAIKDALETIRSPRQWFYLLFAIIILSFQALGPEGPGFPMGYLFFLVFITSIFSQELTVLGVSREAEMFPMVAAAGIPAWRLYLSKWISGFIPTALFGITAAVALGFARGGTFLHVITDAGIVVLGIFPLISYSVMIGCLFPNFKAYRTRRRLSPWVLILNLFFTALLIIFVLLPIGILWHPELGQIPNWVTTLLILFPIGVAVSMFAFAFALGSARLRKFLKDVPNGL